VAVAQPEQARIRSLDGLRAISVSLVMFGHWLFSRVEAENPFRRALSFTYPWGGTGVAIFFGISGYLITSLLVRERERTGRIDLGGFYLRRAFRILPPYWAYLAVTLLIAPAIDWAAYLRAFLFLTDYLPTAPWLGHTWSLSVEEQFYLLWPLLVATLALRGARNVAWALLLVTPIVRTIGLALEPTRTLDSAFHFIVDALMIGCLLALLRSREPQHPLVRWLGSDLAALAAAAFLLVGIPLMPKLSRLVGLPLSPVMLSLRAFAVGAVLLWSTDERNAHRWIVKLLNWRPIVHLGVISYSLYLWQQPILAGPRTTTAWSDAPLPFLVVLLLAEASYRLVERPALALRDRLLARQAPALPAGPPG